MRKVYPKELLISVMLQNRVDPFGQLIRTPARGFFMGNRGLIHNEKQEIVRPFRLKAWITCLLEFKGRRRKVMTPNLYTELFFTDEAAAFAAGHRPCAECRRDDFNRFKTAWVAGNPEYNFNQKTSVQKIDGIMHSERIGADFSKITFKEKMGNLPDGVMIRIQGEAYVIRENKLWLWTPLGYTITKIKEAEADVDVLTPRSVVNALRAGYTLQTSLARTSV